MIEVNHAGFYSSVQGGGRCALRHLGVGLSGAMDTLALSVVNRMLGNDADAAGLEVTMGHASFVFLEEVEVALGGAPLQATLDGRPLPNWWAFGVHAGQTLTLGVPKEGVRSYLAIRGGLASPEVLGSMSTDLKGGFGGHHGRPLQDGDLLPVCPTLSTTCFNHGYGLCPWRLDPYASIGEAEASGSGPGSAIHILPAAQWMDLGFETQRQLLESPWRVSSQSNRVGCLLEGPELPMPGRREMRSHGIMPGVIQLPPSGRPMVQLCDGNTSGGYPVIATVIGADLHRFAQLRPGASIQFSLCDIDQARSLWLLREQFLEDLTWRCQVSRERLCQSPSRTFRPCHEELS